MPSAEHEAVVAMMKSQPKPEGEPKVAEIRAMFAQMASMFPLPEGLVHTAIDADGVPAEWVTMPGADAERVVLYLHGGGYVIGSPETHHSLTGRIAAASGARVLAPDYRLAPEHPFPAAVEDATAAYRYLLDHGVSPRRIVIAGDSAGGGLTLAALLALRDSGHPLPAAGVCLSPWTDLEGTGASAGDPSIDDPMIQTEGLRGFGRLYGGESMRDPLAAPLYADFAGLPPLLIFVGTREILLDDSTRVAEAARKAGVDVRLVAEEGLVHVWPFFGDGVPEAVATIEQIGAYVREKTA
jgi:monoterpene epsilon-lactone hydrolase